MMKRILSLVLCAFMLLSAFTVCSAADEWKTEDIDFTDSGLTLPRNPARGKANTMDTQFWVIAQDEGTTYMPDEGDFDETGIYTPLYQLGAFSSGNDYDTDTEGTDGNVPGMVGGVNKDIDEDTLASIEKTCELAEAQGVKLIFRFAYDDKGYIGTEPDDVSWIVRHIEQIAPILSEYAGTVISVECGMIGPWGEMHSSQYVNRKYADQIIEAWLTGLDESITVQCRNASYIVYYCGMMPNRFLKSLPLTPDSPGYRLGMYNDGYLGTANDYGTWDNIGSTETAKLYRENGIDLLKDQASRIPYGGELAYSTLEQLTDLESPIYTDGFVKELYDTHLCYLRNITSYSPVLNDELLKLQLTEDHDFEGMPDISAYYGVNLQKFMLDHMGYRFVLRSAQTSASVMAGDVVKLRGAVENVGFGNLIGQYKSEFIILDEKGNIAAVTDALIDPASWQSCTESEYEVTLSVPADASGKYSVYLRISAMGYEEDEYGACAVAFANEDIYNVSLGANLIATFEIDGKGGSADTFEQINTGAFTDVKKGAWYEDAVYYAAYHGVMSGVATGKFDPEGTTTRAMVVQVLYNMEGKPSVDGIETPFTDINGKWYEAAVTWAYSAKVVNGTSPTAFSPEGKITREQFAAILYRYSEYKGYPVTERADLSGYTDAGKVSDYAADAMSWANAVGYIGGMTATTLVPTGNATRAQMAQIMMRFMRNN